MAKLNIDIAAKINITNWSGALVIDNVTPTVDLGNIPDNIAGVEVINDCMQSLSETIKEEFNKSEKFREKILKHIKNNIDLKSQLPASFANVTNTHSADGEFEENHLNLYLKKIAK